MTDLERASRELLQALRTSDHGADVRRHFQAELEAVEGALEDRAVAAHNLRMAMAPIMDLVRARQPEEPSPIGYYFETAWLAFVGLVAEYYVWRGDPALAFVMVATFGFCAWSFRSSNREQP